VATRSSVSNIKNRSPWLVQVRARPEHNQRFSYPKQKDAQRYRDGLIATGLKATLSQLETSFQLRIRRQGIADQFITFDTWAEAEQARLHVAANLSVSIVRDYAIAAKTTLRQIMQRYLDEVVPSHKGADIEANRLRRMMRDEDFVDKRLAALCTEDLQDFITDRLTEVAPSTVDRDLDLLSQVIRYADDVWKIAAVESPFKGLRRPKYFNERDRRLSADEEAALLAAARQDENPFLEPAMILALETAMRRSELLALTRNDIHVERRFARVRQAKNGRSRNVPLSSRALQVIHALPATGDERLLDLTANALKIGYFRRVLPASGVEDFHFHDFRHEAISRLAESGKFQLIELQAISGHRDMRMLQRYVHLCCGNLADKVDSLCERTTREYLHRGRRRQVVRIDMLPERQSPSRVPPPAPPTPPTSPVPPWPTECPERPSNVVDFCAVRRAVERAG
jgi:integrase